MYKIYVAEELGCVYKWNAGHEVLEYAPLLEGNKMCFDDFNEVDESLVGDEIVVFHKKEQTFSEVYRYVEGRLK